MMKKGSYLLLERGMTVHGTDGDIGTIADVIAEPASDIFRGFVLSHGLFSHNVFIPEDNLISVEGNVATVSLSHDDVTSLPPYEPPTND